MSLITSQILALKTFPGIGNKTILKIGDSFQGILSKEELFNILSNFKVKMKAEDGEKIPLTFEVWDEVLEAAEGILEKSKAQGIQAISYYEEKFPESLRGTLDLSGKRTNPAVLLFYRGNAELLQSPSVAVIGSRQCLTQAAVAGRKISKALAEKGICIVSGLALGCDTVAHEGALATNEGKTIAILGHGLDRIYPAQNKELAKEILEKGGLLLSEYPIGTTVSNYTLVERDRLQAGLANAVVLLQSSLDGGSMHAAKVALAYPKALFIVEYERVSTEDEKKLEGNRYLLENGGEKISYSTFCEDIQKIIQSPNEKENVLF